MKKLLALAIASLLPACSTPNSTIYQRQHRLSDCGAAVATMLVRAQGKAVTLYRIKAATPSIIWNAQDIINALRYEGIEATKAYTFIDFKEGAYLIPSRVFRINHWVVAKLIAPTTVQVYDPIYGDYTLPIQTFLYKTRGTYYVKVLNGGS